MTDRRTAILTAKERATEVADALLLAAYNDGISRSFHEDQAFKHLIKLVDTLGWKLPAPREKEHANGKHTPGPWAVGERRQVLVPQKCGLLVAQVAKGSVASSVGSFSIDEAEAQANSNLIAAAPDLLEALKDLIDDLEARSKNGVVDCSHGIYCDARQAIAKAEGLS